MVVLPPNEEDEDYNSNYIVYWNNVGLELNRLTHTLGDLWRATTLTLRLSLALPPAVAGAAITVLEKLYTQPSAEVSQNATDQLSKLLKQWVDGFSDLDTLAPSYRFGVSVGNAILDSLDIKPNEPGADQGQCRPQAGRFRFRDDPPNPVKLVPVDPNHPDVKRAVHQYHAPFYGITAKRLAVHDDHMVADPPVKDGSTVDEKTEFSDAFQEVIRLGGAPELASTCRQPKETAGAYFWAYDGANLIGTPPRFYNRILRTLAWKKKRDGPTDETTNAEFARLFALANVAMADAGIFCWRENYHHEFLRPISAVREDTNQPMVDPFWRALGAPSTNTDQISFIPPFPSYPSGHATFGAAVFQVVRLFYKSGATDFEADGPDDIAFDIVSDELDGVSRALRQTYDQTQPITNQPGTVRTYIKRRFESLWEAIFENAISRVWLGVHWRFDAFAANDKASDIKYKTTGSRTDQSGSFPIGGVPLGLEIANDIFRNNLQPTPKELQPSP
ncbi:phosphatidic acid phosphatase type 2/haloperoxidase [Aspergillus alliaceus]|uniref:Phosphatidic acid phosphatase type 2/haloperoxidase n=1 Tax=Petromyces alliaceus TaxID=209559 RepID=A0A5N7C7N6_PETAA|nr:phosphatidic acid phosphatase type 2/haloperoxidase [Aspergillus alliaceus]